MRQHKKAHFAVLMLFGMALLYTPLSAEQEQTASHKQQIEATASSNTPAALGGVIIKSDGKNIWPPKGPGCETLIQCCQAAEKNKIQSAGLFCQLSLAADPADCKKALELVTQFLVDSKADLPPDCSPKEQIASSE